MKSVNYGKSAQDLSLGTYSLGNEMGEGRGGGFRFLKILTFWFLSTKHTKSIETAVWSL